jgi:hypothetical protein
MTKIANSLYKVGVTIGIVGVITCIIAFAIRIITQKELGILFGIGVITTLVGVTIGLIGMIIYTWRGE